MDSAPSTSLIESLNGLDGLDDEGGAPPFTIANETRTVNAGDTHLFGKSVSRAAWKAGK